MKFLLIFHASLMILGTTAVYFFETPRDTLSFGFGGLISFLNLITLVYSWPRILAKKRVALSVGVIVFKFALLGWIMYLVVTSQAFHLGWVAAGLALVIPSTLVTSLNQTQTSSEKVES